MPERGKYSLWTDTIILTARREEKPTTGEKVDRLLDAGQNPPDGVVVSYYLREQPEGELKLVFLDAANREIESFSSREVSPDAQKKDEKKLRVPKEVGINRFAWNMRYPAPTKVKEGFMGSEQGLVGPLAAPGTYQVRLISGEQSYTASFEIQKAPHVLATQEDLEAQFSLLIEIRDRISETHEAITAIRAIRQQVELWEERAQGQEAQDAVTTSAHALLEKLAAIEEELIQVKAKSRGDTLDHPAKLNAKLAALSGVVGSADAAPTRQAYELFQVLSDQLQSLLVRLQECIDADLAAFNTVIGEAGLSAVIPPVLEKRQSPSENR